MSDTPQASSPDEVAALLADTAVLPGEAADAALAAAGVHAVMIWTGTDLDEDERYWAFCAHRDAGAPGAHHKWWSDAWTGFAFYGPDAAANARRARDAAERWSTTEWRVTLGCRPEPDDVRTAEITSQNASAHMQIEAEEVANNMSRVTVATGVYDPAELLALTHELKDLALHLGRPWPDVARGRYEQGTVTCVWSDSPATVEAAQRFAEAVTARDPRAWTITMDGPVANA